MAFSASRLTDRGLLDGVTGAREYHYLTDGTDTVATCEESGYFNNTDDKQNFQPGSRIKITVPGTQTGVPPLKQIVDVGEVVVMSVNSTTGAVDCSADIQSVTVTYT